MSDEKKQVEQIREAFEKEFGRFVFDKKSCVKI
jgi:hypothetical protein